MAKSTSLLVLAALVAGSVGAQASDAALIEAAKKEGALTVYACDPPQTPLYVNRFKQLYPDIAVRPTSPAAGRSLTAMPPNGRQSGRRLTSSSRPKT